MTIHHWQLRDEVLALPGSELLFPCGQTVYRVSYNEKQADFSDALSINSITTKLGNANHWSETWDIRQLAWQQGKEELFQTPPFSLTLNFFFCHLFFLSYFDLVMAIGRQVASVETWPYVTFIAITNCKHLSLHGYFSSYFVIVGAFLPHPVVASTMVSALQSRAMIFAYWYPITMPRSVCSRCLYFNFWKPLTLERRWIMVTQSVQRSDGI